MQCWSFSVWQCKQALSVPQWYTLSSCCVCCWWVGCKSRSCTTATTATSENGDQYKHKTACRAKVRLVSGGKIKRKNVAAWISCVAAPDINHHQCIYRCFTAPYRCALLFANSIHSDRSDAYCASLTAHYHWLELIFISHLSTMTIFCVARVVIKGE